MIKLIQSTLRKQPDAFKSKLPEFANMLHKTLQDEFPEMKKVAVVGIDVCSKRPCW